MLEGGAVDEEKVVEGEPHLEGGKVFLEKSGVEHGGVVGGKSYGNAVAEKFGKRMMHEFGMSGVQLDIEGVCAEVAGGADFQRDLTVGETVHECRAADSGDAVADAFSAENVDSLVDLIGTAGFSGMREEMESVLRSKAIDATELRKRQGKLVASESEGDDAFVAKLGGDEGDFHGRSGTELTDGVEDELDLRSFAGLRVAAEDIRKGCEICCHILLTKDHDAYRKRHFCVDDTLFMKSCCGVMRE